VACAHGAAVKANPAAQFPLAVNEATPAFLFPINMSHLGSGGDPLAMGVTVTAGVASKFGKQVVSGQQLFDLVGNLSFELAEQVKSQASAGTWTMTGPAETIASTLAQMMQTIISKAVELKLLDKPINFKYVIALHSHGEQGIGGKTLNVTSWGGIYDVETKQIVSYIDSSDTFANTPEAVMGQLPSVYNTIISQLIQGTATQQQGGEQKAQASNDAPASGNQVAAR
jgi:hypothetical protein